MGALAGKYRPEMYGVAHGPRRFHPSQLEYLVLSLQREPFATSVFRTGLYLLNNNPIRCAVSRPALFRWDGQSIPYLTPSVSTERRVEIPIALDFLQSVHEMARVLEVGNTVGRNSLRSRESWTSTRSRRACRTST